MSDELHKAGHGTNAGEPMQKSMVLPNTHLVVPMPPVAPPRAPEQAIPSEPVGIGTNAPRERVPASR